MLRQLAVVAVLFVIMTMMPKLVGLQAGAVNPVSMAAFGFIVLAAYTLGELAERIRLPHITGYLITGLICGPHILGMVDDQVVGDLELFNVLAVALIGLSAGGSLEIAKLRKGIKVIGGVIAGQFIAVMLGVGALVMLLALPIPGLGLAFLQDGGLGRAVAVALLMGTIAAAFSPAATIAVIHGVRAKGPVTDNVLGIAILNNVVVVAVFAAALAVAQRLAGASHGDTRLILELLTTLGGSIALGLGLGLALWLYLRFVGTHLLLLVVGLCFVVTHLAEQLGTEPVLAFIVAGFTFANASPRRDQLFAVVDRLAMPIYVVFFFVAGAGLHLDALAVLWPAALAVFAARLVSLWLGTRVGTQLTGGPDGLGRYGWMTFGPQAGIALSLAMVAGHAFGEWGATFETLAVATIGLNELVGPALLQTALGLTGEAKAARQGVAAGPSDASTPCDPSSEQPCPEPQPDQPRHARDPQLPEWLPEPGRTRKNPWGPPPTSRSERLTQICAGLRTDLQQVVRTLREGAISRRREQAIRFMGLLRREFLRAHRHITLTVAADDPEAWRSSIRRERGELASRWERLLLDRAATTDFRQDLTTFQQIVREVDHSCEDIPEAIELPLEASWADPRDDDSLRLSVLRWWARARRSAAETLGVEPAGLRVVELRALARYCMSGLAPTHLIEAAALIALGERHLLARARAVLESYHQALEGLLSQDTEAAERQLSLERIRADIEEEFSLANREVDRMADDTVRVTASALGRAYREFVRMADSGGTAELPPSRYRFSRIYDARERAMKQLEEGLSSSRDLTRGIASNLAMELEMIRLQVRVREAVEAAATGLERDLRGKLVLQMERLGEGLTNTIGALRALLADGTSSRTEVQGGIQQAAGPLAHLLHEVLGIAEKLRSALKNETAVGPLLRSLNSEIDELTDRFLVVTDPPPTRGRSFPPRPQSRDLHFREAVRAYMEAEAGRDLTMSLAALRSSVDEVYVGIDELQRVLAFNSDLAGAELDVLPEEQLTDETLQLLREMLVGTLQRLANRVDAMQQAASDLPSRGGEAIRSAITGNLERLTDILVEGRHGELKLRLALDAASAGGRELHGVLRELRQAGHQLEQVVRVALGQRSINRVQAALGLRDRETEAAAHPETFTPPSERVPIPTVYRRLFSDQGLEGGDLLSGREADVDRVRRTLTGRGSPSRTVSVVGVAGIGNTAVVNTLLRGLPDNVGIHRIRLTACTSADQVEEQILAPMRDSRGDIAVIEGMHWLFSIRPGGFAPLRALLDGVIEDRGRNGWLVSTERPVWSYAKRVLPLEDVFCEHFALGALSVEELRNTLLLRHVMSGYRLHFQRPHGHIGWWLQELITRKSAEEVLYERHFFEQLHQATGGILSDALRLWLASVAGVGSSTDTITIGTMPEPPLEPLRKLPLDDLITLRQLARQGRITADDHAQQFRTEPTWSAGYLTRLEHRGLLQRVDECCYRLAPDLAGAIHQVLRERRLMG
jgi:Kef-type K+ transport system membrane component KefB